MEDGVHRNHSEKFYRREELVRKLLESFYDNGRGRGVMRRREEVNRRVRAFQVKERDIDMEPRAEDRSQERYRTLRVHVRAGDDEGGQHRIIITDRVGSEEEPEYPEARGWTRSMSLQLLEDRRGDEGRRHGGRNRQAHTERRERPDRTSHPRPGSKSWTNLLDDKLETGWCNNSKTRRDVVVMAEIIEGVNTR